MSWIIFDPIGRSTSDKTSVWNVVAREGGNKLGEVSWFGRWRKYCFFPEAGTVFEKDCLRDVANWCESATREHSTSKPREKQT